MSNDNYPAGVTDAHPHFNPQEGSFAVECGADEALVVPNYWVQLRLNEILNRVYRLPSESREVQELVKKLDATLKEASEMAQEREYECGFKDTLDLDISEEAHWDCPRCGNERTTDTVPEERDPDEGWDNRYDD